MNFESAIGGDPIIPNPCNAMQNTPPNFTRRLIICSVTVVITLLFVYSLCLRMAGGIYYLEALNNFRDGHYGVSLHNLKKTIEFLENESFAHKEFGKVYYQISLLKKRAREALTPAIKSKDYFTAAANLNPLDAETAYELAKVEFRLETLNKILAPENNQESKALYWFKESLRLKPSSITFRLAMAYYLHRNQQKEALINLLRELARIYPGSYRFMRDKPYLSSDIRSEVKTGLFTAIDEGNSPGQAHRALSSLHMDERNWDLAIFHYRKFLDITGTSTDTKENMHLGYLYLKNEDNENAVNQFIRVLANRSEIKRNIEMIYNYYKQENQMSDFQALYTEIINSRISTLESDFIYAKSLMEMKDYPTALKILGSINNREPNARACYMMARIFEAENNWDSMELMIQKATVLDPENSEYHLIFSRVLKRLNKLERAEKEATSAIKYRDKPVDWLFNYRADLRWELEDYKGADGDWSKAISLKPDNAGYYARAAEAYAKQLLIPVAVDYYKKALDLQPGNNRYRKRYEELQAMI
ncbi:tetratricopeptide repeat protein [Thermodesulfobacteriota bacterium]